MKENSFVLHFCVTTTQLSLSYKTTYIVSINIAVLGASISTIGSNYILMTTSIEDNEINRSSQSERFRLNNFNIILITQHIPNILLFHMLSYLLKFVEVMKK